MQAKSTYSLFKVHRLLLLAKIKGKKVYFRKLVTFMGKGGNLPPANPLNPLEDVSMGLVANRFSRGEVEHKFQVLGGGAEPVGTPPQHL